MAAAILESVAFPRPSSGFQRVSSLGRGMISASSISGRRRMGLLPEFKGLKISRCSVRVAAATGARVVRRGVVCEAPETAVEVPDVTKSTWQSLVMESDRPVLVEFWAPWCGPCRMIHPVIGQLSVEYAGKLDCFKLNTDESPDIATQYGIRSIPTIIIFKNGEKKDAVIGAVPKTTLIASIEKFL